jgi:STE24 endopeptidase
VSYFWDSIISFLNAKAVKTEIPEEFKDVYPKEKYEKSQNYLKDSSRFSLVSSTFSTIAILVFYFAGGFAWWNEVVTSFAWGSPWTGLAYIGGIGFASMLISLPFSFYSTFVIEEKYGFNKSTKATFFKDQALGIVLGALIGGPIMALLFWFFESLGQNAWWVAWLSLSVIQIFMTFLAPVVIMPLFNKFTPIEEGELKEEVQKYAKSQDFELEGLYTMDGSKRSTKANAFFTGFGKFRRVVLFDTLVEKQSVPELVSVLAHEIGHFKKGHIIKQIALSIGQSALMFYVLGFFINSDELAQAFGVQEATVYTGFVFFMFLYSPVSEILNLASLYLSRKYEFEADEFAVKTYGKPDDLISALKKLSVDSLSNLYPHPLKVFWAYTHPPILERLEVLKSYKSNS